MGQTLQEQLHALVKSMYEEGILEQQQFDQLQQLQDVDNPGFIAEVLTMFLEDTDRIMNELAPKDSVLDWEKITGCVHQLKGSSASVGAQRVTNACVEFRQAYESHDGNRCKIALNLIHQEYFIIREKFVTMIELENCILKQQ